MTYNISLPQYTILYMTHNRELQNSKFDDLNVIPERDIIWESRGRRKEVSYE